ASGVDDEFNGMKKFDGIPLEMRRASRHEIPFERLVPAGYYALVHKHVGHMRTSSCRGVVGTPSTSATVISIPIDCRASTMRGSRSKRPRSTAESSARSAGS